MPLLLNIQYQNHPKTEPYAKRVVAACLSGNAHNLKVVGSNPEVHERDMDLMMWLHKDDFERSISMMPKDYQRRSIRKALPELNNNQVEETIKYIQEKREVDYFNVLQEDVFENKGGQLLMNNLSPNFEIALFLCQVTGSFLLTDSHYRWDEIMQAQRREKGMVIYNWSDLTDSINELEYTLNGDFKNTYKIREAGQLGKIRKSIKEIYKRNIFSYPRQYSPRRS